MKLAVGVRDVAHLRALQAARAKSDPPLRHRTRTAPRRADEVCGGGSIYWVIQGAMCVRQRILRIVPDTMQDGSACAGLVLGRRLVRVAARPVRAFQGWRYLDPADAPPDLTAGKDEGLPPALSAELRGLGLL
ncbi:MAG TPA: DUF1489 domain-containing protein [Acidisphaera sp.]|nr:DUF1489 domain-containing protein [Acidisphaera sp.]